MHLVFLMKMPEQWHTLPCCTPFEYSCLKDSYSYSLHTSNRSAVRVLKNPVDKNSNRNSVQTVLSLTMTTTVLWSWPSVFTGKWALPIIHEIDGTKKLPYTTFHQECLLGLSCLLSEMNKHILFDERGSGSSQILCSYLTRRSGVRYDTEQHQKLRKHLTPTLML